MRLWPWRKKALTADSGVIESLQTRDWSPYPLLGGGARQRVARAYETAQTASYSWMYFHSPAVRTVVDLLLRNIGQLDLRLYEEIDEAERQPRFDHPAALSLRYPDHITPSDKFVRQLFLDFLTYGNAYALMLPASSGQLTLKQVPAHRIKISGNDFFDPQVYIYTREDGQEFPFQPDQVFHWRGENPLDPRYGMSPLETLRSVIAEDAAMEAANVELAKSGMAQPSWVFRPTEAVDWSNEARQRFEEDLEARMRRSSSKPVVLEEGMELRDFGVSPRDAEALEVRKWTVEKVADLYGVPLGMVGLAPDVEKARAAFVADTLPPYCESFTRALNTLILVRYYGEPDYCFEFNLDEKLMGDERMKSLTSASGRPVLTTNEARAMVNKPPIDGGDELITPANVIVGDNPLPSPQTMPVQDPNKPLQDGSHRQEVIPPGGQAPKALERRGGTALHRDSDGQLLKAVPGAVDPHNRLVQFSERRKSDIRRQRRNVTEAQAMVERFRRRQASALRAKAVEFDIERWDRELTDDIYNLAHSIIEREGGIYVAKLAGEDFDMSQVEHWLKSVAEGSAHGFNEATRRNIQQMGVDDALDRVQGLRVATAGASLGARATLLARKEAARQAPDTEFRMQTWVADTDRHAELDGVSVPLGSDWGGIEPGSEPNCQCSLTID